MKTRETVSTPTDRAASNPVSCESYAGLAPTLSPSVALSQVLVPTASRLNRTAIPAPNLSIEACHLLHSVPRRRTSRGPSSTGFCSLDEMCDSAFPLVEFK